MSFPITEHPSLKNIQMFVMCLVYLLILPEVVVFFFLNTSVALLASKRPVVNAGVLFDISFDVNA